MKSMTGFGRSTQIIDSIQCTIEIKSVNARFLDVAIRSPKQLNPFEHLMRTALQDGVHRGKVEVFVTLEDMGDRPKEFIVNRTLKEQVQEILVTEGFYQNCGEVPLQAIMAISSDWIQCKESVIDELVLSSLVLNTMNNAVRALVEMRHIEGRHLRDDIENRLSQMESILATMDENKMVAVEQYKVYIEGKITELLGKRDITINEDRLLQEVAILADKTDITEEIVRFRSHVVQLKNTLTKDEPIGRKLDFIIQEMNREVNTMGSKAMDMDIIDRVVQLKCELEKVREQVQNIE